MRIMGLDFGAKTTGIAMSDLGCTLASPVETVFRSGRRKSEADCTPDSAVGRRKRCAYDCIGTAKEYE